MLRRHLMSLIAALAVGLVPGVDAAETGAETDGHAETAAGETGQTESETVRLEVVYRDE
jgi:hypothetical protein